MRNIAIVEDEDSAASLLGKYIDEFSKEENIEFNVVRFKSASEFLMDYKKMFAVVFMDIQMPGINGIEASVELRKLDKVISLVFITSMVQHAQKGYEVDAVSFMIKPVNYFDFSLKFKKALNVYSMNEERSLTITVPNGLCRISTDKLKYVEVANHILKYHLVDDIIEMSGSLSKVEKELSGYGLLRCNSCYLVNPKFVAGVKGQDVKVGEEWLRISRPKRKSFMTELTNWLAGGGKQ